MDLLDHRNKAEYFIELLQNGIEETENARCDYEDARLECCGLYIFASSCTAQYKLAYIFACLCFRACTLMLQALIVCNFNLLFFHSRACV